MRSKVLLAAMLASLAAGCASGPTVEDDVRSAFEEIRRASAHGRIATVCERLSRDAARQAGLVGHGRPLSCWTDVAELVDGMRASRARQGAPARVVDVEVAGDRATLTVVLGRGSPTRFRFVRERGWRLDALFGVTAPPPEDLR